MNQMIFEELKELKPKYFKHAFPKIFSWEELQHLLNLRPFLNDKRFIITDTHKYYYWPNQGYMSDINSFPPSLLENDILKNHVCYISDCSRANKQLNQICGQIESSFENCVTDAHIYFSIGENLTEGFGIHMDDVHVLVVHVEGKSRFELWDSSITEEKVGGRCRVKNIDESPIIDTILETGDAVFIPIRTFHRVTSLTKRLSVSFPIVLNANIPPQERNWIELKI